MNTLEEWAQIIRAAIQSAAEDGFFLWDDGYSLRLGEADVNDSTDPVVGRLSD